MKEANDMFLWNCRAGLPRTFLEKPVVFFRGESYPPEPEPVKNPIL